MTRYYFHTTDNAKRTTDVHGDPCTSRDEIKDNAVGILVGMAQDELPDGEHHHFGVEVTNQDGKLVFSAELDLKSRWADEYSVRTVDDIS